MSEPENMTTDRTSEEHPVYPGGPPCQPNCPGKWSAYHDGYADGYENALATRAASVGEALRIFGHGRAAATAVAYPAVVNKVAAHSKFGPGTFTYVSAVKPGDRVKFGLRISPAYMQGVEATVVRVKYTKVAVVKLDQKVGRFPAGVELSVSPSELVKP